MSENNRRSFLGSSATAAGVLILKPETVFGTQANSALEVGIIGCGGRGNFIGGFFVEYTGARISALADPFQDRMEAAREKLRASGARLFPGLNGYKELIASNVDAVAVMSPPYFHPEQVAAAVAAGKHVFLAKPVAVDVPGCRSILASGEKAKGKLSFVVDFQTRVQPVFKEAASRVHRGDIGTPVLGHVYYHAGRLRPKTEPGMSAAQARLSNWVFDKVLSGDIIVEQNIHVLDAGNWYLKSHPVKASGTGGRKARVDVGDCWDHFLVNFWYPNGVKVDFSSAQFTKGYNDLCIRIYGSGGTADTHYNGTVRITGDKPWDGVEKDDTFRQGAITNVRDFAASIRSGNYLNNAQDSVESNLTAILGRMAAYRESAVTWDEMMRANERLEANLKL
ncbi:MAG: Gfo/Idh/MocA family oxidoreductase [Bryobacteraceae bacterium]|nr:Gfo/Idh/MocA family oxidoreductase [Bryobacterales bacterium]MEB2361117.1 Gfo/Idh/MocA family oxidoreductase [Bryobacterales bacterium]NUM99853.1 Gfo/Idh/MocA family oxidoreductase [Bryobacteraceae bacterium]